MMVLRLAVSGAGRYGRSIMPLNACQPLPDIAGFIGADELPDGPIAHAYAWWRGLGGGAVPPPSAALDLAAVPDSFLPHLAVTTAFRADGRVRVVFCGSLSALAAGSDPTGRYFDEFYPPDMLEAALGFQAAIVRDAQPIFGQDQVGTDEGVMYHVPRIGLPFQGADGSLDRLAIVMHYQPTPENFKVRLRVFQDRARLLRRELRLVAL
ncbi:hypothetical protein FBZ87_104125 [Nitrospirillum amazonense]|uniref:PAS domain-containing protein n=1 Tax=Nitrospirillum amazonense TaxID=28077 RepID=A0A560JWD4_9PROT|nr:hypothetical protein FBZ87_104125 [Nitrospirillum amazonense]